MSKKKEKKEEQQNVKYITSLALAVVVEDEVRHLQFTVVENTDTKELRCFFDVVDPSKVKLAE